MDTGLIQPPGPESIVYEASDGLVITQADGIGLSSRRIQNRGEQLHWTEPEAGPRLE
jgi:hypothetical protein